MTGAAKSGAIPLAWTTGANASAALTGTTGTTLARTAWAPLARATGTGSAGCGLVALLFTEKLLNLFAAGPFLVVNFSVAVFIEIFEE